MKQQTIWQLLCIQIGGAICLPVIIVGQMLAQSYGFWLSLWMILIGNGLLLICGIFTAKMGISSRQGTIELAVKQFGFHGARFFGAIFLFVMTGWFAIQINVISDSVGQMLSVIAPSFFIPPFVCNLFLGILMTIVSACGIRGLNVLSQGSLLLLLGTLAVSLFTAKDVNASLVPQPFSAAGVSLIIATGIGCVIDLPTYWRFARSQKDGFWAVILFFAIALPLIESLGVYLGVRAPEHTVLSMLTQGGGLLWNIWVALFLLLAGWTTNNMNLYSGGVNSFAVFPGLTFAQRTILIGMIGTLLSCFPVLSHFTAILEAMGIMIAGMGAVVIVSYSQKTIRVTQNYLAFALGTGLGFLCLFDVLTLDSPVIVAFLGSMGATAFLQFSRRKDAISAS